MRSSHALASILVLVVGVVLGGCSNDESPSSTLECGPGGSCPAGFTCNATTNLCVMTSGSPDARAADARAMSGVDAAVPFDAQPAADAPTAGAPDAPAASAADAPAASAPDAPAGSPPDAPTAPGPDAPLPPVETRLDSHPAGATNQATASFTFSSTTAGATFECALGMPFAFVACVSPKSYSVADGSHDFAVRAVSGARTDATPATFAWTVDTVAPRVTIQPLPGDQSSASGTVLYTADDAAATFSCKLDTGGFAACPASGYAFTGLSDGSHTLTVHATDAVQNTGPDASYTWTAIVPVTVTVMNGLAPVSGASIVASDASGRQVGLQTSTDAGGHAHIVVPAGGMVSATFNSLIYTVEDVQPGEDYLLGPLANVFTPGSLTIARSLPGSEPGATCYIDVPLGIQGGTCGAFASPKTLLASELARDTTGKLNFLVIALGDPLGGSLPVAFGWAPGVVVPPDGSASASVAAWASPIDVNVVISGLAAGTISAGVWSGVQMHGQTYLHREGSSAVVSNPPASITIPVKNPPAGVGEAPFFFTFANPTGAVSQYIMGADAAVDYATALPAPTVSIDRPSRTLSWTRPPGLSAGQGVVTTLSWSSGGSSTQWTIASPSAGPLVLPQISGPGNAAINVTQVFLEVTTWDDADFRRSFSGLADFFLTTFQTVLPAYGPGAVARATRVTTLIPAGP